MEDAARILEIESFIPMTTSDRLSKVILLGDKSQLQPVVYNKQLEQFSNMNQSLFVRFLRFIEEKDVIHLPFDNTQKSSSLTPLFNWSYDSSLYGNSSQIEQLPGFKYNYQFVNIDDYHNKGETEPLPHFYQNLGEAEYATALYAYLRMIGYPSERITILTSYQGQKCLIRNIVEEKCANLGLPKKITTIDRYQGQENDIVILSLVRTNHPGHLNDSRRISVALSSAKKGLFVLGRVSMFTSKCKIISDLMPTFTKDGRPTDSLVLLPKQTYSSINNSEEVAVRNVFELATVVSSLMNGKDQ